MSRLRDALKSGEFAVTAEVVPPLSADARVLCDDAAPLKGLVHAVNVTDAAGARATMSSFAAGAILLRDGIEPVVQMTCRDRNRIAFLGDVIGAAAQGVRNILILHGDDPAAGDMPEAKAVHDLNSREALRWAKMMRDEGRLPSGRKLAAPPKLFIGTADTPQDPAPDWSPDGLMSKAEAGADFVQTQFCFDAGVARRYLARLTDAGVTERLKFLIGLGPLASARSAAWMRDNLFGVRIPDSIIRRLTGAEDETMEGRRICIEVMQALVEVHGVSGVHIMAPLQAPAVIAEVIAEAGFGVKQSRPQGAGDVRS